MTRRFLVPLSTDHVDYNLDSTSVNAEGRLRWDSDYGTLSIGLENGIVELPIGQKQGAYVKNTSGVNIGKGQAVQFSGAAGGKIEIEKAVSNGTVPSKYMFGVTAEPINNDDFGFVVTEGYIRGLNTNGLTIGALLYFDPNTPGNLTPIEPPSTAFNIPIAAVTFVNQSAGTIYVRMNMEYQLKEIEDVSLSSLSNGDALVYNSASAIWKNEKTVSSLSGTPNEIDVSASVGAVTLSLPDTILVDSLDLNEAQITAKLNTINVTTPFLIDSFSSSLYRGAEYTFQLSQNNVNFTITKVVIIHNSTDLAITEYGSVEIGDSIPYSFNGSFSLGNMEMTITCPTANSFPVGIKFTRTLIDL
jgi:hypothetical protein